MSVADLVGVFNTWLKQKMSKDIFALLKPPNDRGFSWKTSPDHQWLSDVGPLFFALADVAPNTVLTSKKMLLAFESLQKDGTIINTSKMEDNVFHEWLDQTVRILFSKFREIKKDPSTKQRIEKRCTADQLHVISQVLAKIKVGDEEEPKKPVSHVTLSPPKSQRIFQNPFLMLCFLMQAVFPWKHRVAFSKGFLVKTLQNVQPLKSHHQVQMLLLLDHPAQVPSALEHGNLQKRLHQQQNHHLHLLICI